MTIDFRGRGQSRGGPGSRSPDDGVHFDVLAATVDEPERLTGRKQFILIREDVSGGGVPRLPEIREQYDHAPDPKEWVILEGSAHAQLVFETDQGERLMHEILRFLSEQYLRLRCDRQWAKILRAIGVVQDLATVRAR